MARIRTVKPEFWTSEQVMECSPLARLMFIGLWNFCDDYGRHPCPPKQIKALIFPGDDFSPEDVQRMLDELSTNGLVRLYEVDGKRFLEVTGWHHQKIDRRQDARFPANLNANSPTIRRTIGDGEEGNTEGKGKEDLSPPLRSGSSSANAADLPEQVDLKGKRTKADDTELLQAVAGLWNDTARTLGLSEIESLSDKRIATLRARIRQLGDFGLAADPMTAFQRWAQNIRGSPFLRGSSGSDWRADFDFAISPKGFVKIMENGYAGQANGFAKRH